MTNIGGKRSSKRRMLKTYFDPYSCMERMSGLLVWVEVLGNRFDRNKLLWVQRLGVLRIVSAYGRVTQPGGHSYSSLGTRVSGDILAESGG